MTGDAPRSTRGQRSALRGLALLLGTGALLLLAALAATQTAAFRELLREQIVRRVNAVLAARVSVGAIEGNLFGSLIVRDAVLTLDDGEVFAVDLLEATYRVLPLLTRGRLAVERVHATGVRGRLEHDARGWNVERIVVPSAEPEHDQGGGLPIAISVREVVIDEGELDLVTPERSDRIRQLSLHASAEIDAVEQRATLSRLALVLPERALQLVDAKGEFVHAADGSMALTDVRLRTTDSRLGGNARLGADLRDLDVQVMIERLATGELQRLLGVEIAAADLSGTVSAKGPRERVAVAAELAAGDAGGVRLTGDVDLANQRLGYDVRAELERLDLANLLGTKYPRSELTATLTASGAGTTLEEVKARFTAELGASTILDTRLQQLSLQGTIADREVAATATVASERGSGKLDGRVDLVREQYAVTLEADQLEPGPLLGRADLGVRASGRMTVSGSGFNPATARAQAEVALARTVMERLEIRALDARLALADSRLVIEQLTLDSNVARATASGAIGLGSLVGEGAGVARGEVRYRARCDDLGVLAELGGQRGVRGRASIEGSARGSVAMLDVDAALTGAGLAVADVQIADVDAQIQARAMGTKQASATVSARARQLRVAGHLFTQAQPEVSWRAGGEAQLVDVALEVHEDERHSHALRARAEITPDEIRAFVDALRFEVGEQRAEAVGTTRITWRDGRADIEGFELRANGGTIRLNGAAGTRGEQSLNLHIADVALAPILQSYGLGVEGTLSGDARLSGTAAVPRVDVAMAIEEPVVEGVAYERLRVDLHVGEGEGRVAASVVQSGHDELTVNAELPVVAALSPFHIELGEHLRGRVQAGALDLAIFDPLIPQVSKLRGTLQADLTLGGSPRAPEMVGRVAIVGGSAKVRATGLEYQPIELQMRVDGRALSLDTLRIASGEGSLTGSGRVVLSAAGAEGEASFALQRFPLFQNQFGEGITNGELTISGSSQAPQVDGRIELDRLVLKVPENLPGTVRPPDPTITVIGPAGSPVEGPAPSGPQEARFPGPEADTTERVPPPGPTPGAVGVTAGAGPYDRATIRIEVRVPHNAWVRRSDTEIELRGTLSVVKTPGRPVAVAGEINAVRGWYTFQGRKFTVEEGSVTLTGQDLNPLLNVVARYQTVDYVVRARIGGTVRAPTIKLESEPTLEQADILSVLVFGRPTNQLNQGESQDLRTRALSVAGGYAAAELRRSVADALGVDTLEIEPGSEGLRHTSASVGKYLTEDIFVSLSHKFAEQNVQQLRVQYFVTPRWTIETTADTVGDSAIDVYWRRRY